MADLRTALTEAFAQHQEEQAAPETHEVPAAPASTETPEQKSERVRDAGGRFAKPDNAQDAAAQSQPQPERVPRPTSWRKEYWDHFDKLDPSVAKYINEREQDFHKGIDGYKSKAQQADQWAQAISPYLQNFQAVGRQPVDAVSMILQTEHNLRHGSPQQKQAILFQLANEYGVDLGQQYPQPAFDPNQFSQMIDQRVASTMMERDANIQLEQFMASPPEHIQEVQGTMIQLLQSGMASSYQEAYDKAVRLHPGIHDAILAKQQEEAAAKKREEQAKAAEAARAKAVSVKGAGTGKQTDGGGGKDRRSIIKDALGAANNTY